jgi:hypothetical protein
MIFLICFSDCNFEDVNIGFEKYYYLNGNSPSEDEYIICSGDEVKYHEFEL